MTGLTNLDVADVDFDVAMDERDNAPKPEGELCARCKQYGSDRRTLWMGCLYAMEELSQVPFEKKEVELRPIDPTSDRTIRTMPFYTLRVCKLCRASWLNAISMWFSSAVSPEIADKLIGNANIPVRIRGSVQYMTEAEYAEYKGKS